MPAYFVSQASRFTARARDVSRRLCREALPAAGVAEVVRDAPVRRGLAGTLDGDGHAADGVDCLREQRFDRLRAGVPPRDELGEDRDRDLLLARRAEVETGRAADAGERLLAEAAPAQRGEHDARAARARDEPHVARPRPRAPPRVRPRRRAPSSRRRRRLRPRRARRHPPADRTRELREGVRGGALADDDEERSRERRLEQHLDTSLRRAGALGGDDVGRCALARCRTDRSAGAAASAVASARSASRITIGSEHAPPTQPTKRPVRRHERAVATLGRGGRFDPDDGREHVRLALAGRRPASISPSLGVLTRRALSRRAPSTPCRT